MGFTRRFAGGKAEAVAGGMLPMRIFAGGVIPTRSCQKFSKQICLWDLVQGIGIISILQIVMAI